MFVRYIQIRRCASIFGPYLVATCVRDIYPQVWCVLLFRTCVFVDAFFHFFIASVYHMRFQCVVFGSALVTLTLLCFRWWWLLWHHWTYRPSPVESIVTCFPHSRGLSLPGFCQLCYNTFCSGFYDTKRGISKKKMKSTLVSVLW